MKKTITRDLDLGCISCSYDGLGLTMVDLDRCRIWTGYGDWIKRYKAGEDPEASPLWVYYRRLV